jgi:tetraacyldisaccharide 4'-kinase
VKDRLLRGALRVIESPYTWVVAARNRGFDTGRRPTHRVGVPVVSVGNVTLGGTGKTPMVAWLARWFRQHDVRVTLVSRGYQGRAGQPNDEAIELEQQLPDVPHLQDPDRVAAAQLAIEEFECQLVVLDDGFQHRRLGRDLDIVLLDALEPYGCEHVFPRGTLREPLSNLERADVIVLSRAGLVSRERRDEIRSRVEQIAGGAVWVEIAHRPVHLLGARGDTRPIDAMLGKRVAAFCGIGNPSSFRAGLESCGYDLAAFHALADHHDFRRDDIEWLDRWATQCDADALVCTHKDLVKVGVDRIGSRPLWALSIGVEILSGGDLLEVELRRILEMIPPTPTDLVDSE